MGQVSIDGIRDLRPHVRRGIVFDKWPFRLDISVEYQDWILVAMCVIVLMIWTTPCICGRLKSKRARSFTSWIYTRLHMFYWTALYVTLGLVMFTLGVLPDWTVDEFIEYLGYFTNWILDHLVKVIESATIIFVLFLVFKFRERVLVAAGLEHIRLFSWSITDPFGFRARRRPIEIFVWKVEGLQSSGSKAMKPNDVFIECHHGDNEAMRTRVHNNAGRGSLIKESFQLNIDENTPAELLHILVKDQTLIASSEVARLVLSVAELCGIEDQTGKRRSHFMYSTEHFVPLSLSPAGQIWIAAAPVDDRDDGPATADDDGLVTC